VREPKAAGGKVTARKHDAARSRGRRRGALGLALGALGIVYGDIGTSPLYAVTQIFFGYGRVPVTPENVVGCISLVVWTLTAVIAVKYGVLALRADADGEGGTFALYSLLHRYKRAGGVGVLLPLLMLAAGLLFGEGMITPAISVLSAVEGLRVATPAFAGAVVPVTLVILTGLFALQHQGTSRVGRIFGPVVLCWLAAIFALGVRQVALHPQILSALDPRSALDFLLRGGVHANLLALGGVVLAITGGEALFADLGHFGRGPIRASWFTAVYPALLASYLGQGAFLLGGEPVAGASVFYSLVPRPLLLPMIVLATAAAIIASQALVAGAFSLSSQAVRLGLLPRLKIVHTHHAHEGQIYLPFVNAVLYAGCVALVIGFGSSARLAAAYGLSMTAAMLTTSISLSLVARLYWGWTALAAAAVFGPLAALEAALFASKSLQLFEGGFIPLGVGFVLFNVMTTWRWGRKATFAAYASKRTMTVERLLEIKRESETFLERNAVLMTPKPVRSASEPTPPLLQFFWDRYGVLPKNILFVEVVHRKTPYVHDERYHVTVFERDRTRGSVISVTVHFGFMEDPNVERVLEDLAGHHQIDLPKDPHRWIVHVTQERVLPAKTLSLPGRMRLRVFSLLRQVSQPAYYYYGLGDEVQLSMEIMPVRVH